MDRRTIQFFVISLAIILASQVLQTWLFPRPPEPAGAQAGNRVADQAGPPANAAEPAGPAATGSAEQAIPNLSAAAADAGAVAAVASAGSARATASGLAKHYLVRR